MTTQAQPVTQATSGQRHSGRTARSSWILYFLGMAALLILLFAVRSNDYWLNIVTLSFLFGGAAVAWNLIGGFGGQLSLGHGVFFAIGAYTVGILYGQHNWSVWLCFVVAVPAAMIVAGLTSWPIFRLRGPFFAMATLALNQVAIVLATYFAGFTGGPQGITLPFKPSLSSLTFIDRWNSGLVMLVFVAIAVAIANGVSRARLGYALRAVREDDEAAAAAGFSVFRTKMTGMLLSAGLTAIAGCLFATYIGYIDPSSTLSLADIGVRFVLIALLGGTGTVIGPVIGALILIPAITQLQGSLSGSSPGVSLAAVGLLLVLIPLLLRRGVVGTAVEVTAKMKGRIRR